MDTPTATPLTTSLDARVNRYDVSAKTAYREMREHAEGMERGQSLLSDALDLARDELRRIKACPACDSEIAQLCDRAMLNIVQRVPVIVQRDRAEDKLGRARTALHQIVHIWETKSEACADNSHAAELMAEQAREAIAKPTP